MPLPSFRAAGSARPVQVVRPGSVREPLAPYLAVEAPADPPMELALTSGGDRLAVRYDGGYSLVVTAAGQTTTHRSRRSGRPEGPVDRVALVLTGTQLTVLGCEARRWVVRGRVDVRDRLDPHDEPWLAGLSAEGAALSGFGQLGLRDLRLATHADGTPYRDGDRLLLTATSAGPGFFGTGHASVWALDPGSRALEHRSDLFLRRPGTAGAYGDHACHLLRDGDRWLLASSTWGDFDPTRSGAAVAVTLAETSADLLTGRHLLDTRPLPLPTSGLVSIGVWDPHLVRTDTGWLAAYVSASKFFAFAPVVASGPSLDDLSLRAALPSARQEIEGPTLHRVDGEWRLLASDGRRRRYPVCDLDLREVDELDAPYHSNIPWPTLVPHDGGLLLVGFDGEPYGGRLAGHGSHGAVRFAVADLPGTTRSAATRVGRLSG